MALPQQRDTGQHRRLVDPVHLDATAKASGQDDRQLAAQVLAEFGQALQQAAEEMALVEGWDIAPDLEPRLF